LGPEAGGVSQQYALQTMSRVLIERKLIDVAQRLKRAREELAIIEEQLVVLNDAADEARIRSLVSETPLAHREYTEAQRHADAMGRTRKAVEADVAELQASQDDLLDRLIGESR
jgi:hypothetical protein